MSLTVYRNPVPKISHESNMDISNLTNGILLEMNYSKEENNSCHHEYDTMNLRNVLCLNEALKSIIDTVMLALMLVTMLSIGCEISWSKLKDHIKHPIGIGIGIACQFFIIPLTTYTVMRSTAVSGLYATEMLIISCCPGGILSNAFIYLCNGDLALSISTTTLSAFLSLGATPLNLWIYGRSFETKYLILPYTDLFLSFISVPILAIIGMLLRWKFVAVSRLITKGGKCASLLIIIICIILEVVAFPDMFVAVPGNLYGVVLTLPVIGLCLGYILAFSFKQDVSIRKTIAIESGIQNIPIALTIIWYSFDPEEHKNIILLPCLYAFATMTGYTILCLMYHLYKQYVFQRIKKEEGFDLELTDKHNKHNIHAEETPPNASGSYL